ncbi:MAG: DinB family protein [Flavobacteriaceae bacterium]|nr:DinB family protein [Flavobacteriaceae bacterium]
MQWTFDILEKNRKLMASFLDNFSVAQLNRIPEGFNNNMIWNIAHVIATQQLLTYKLSGIEMTVDSNFVKRYKKGTQPENLVSVDAIAAIKSMLFSSVEQTKIDYAKDIFQTFELYTTSTGSTLRSFEDAMAFNNFHEGIHLGYVLAMKKLV